MNIRICSHPLSIYLGLLTLAVGAVAPGCGSSGDEEVAQTEASAGAAGAQAGGPAAGGAGTPAGGAGQSGAGGKAGQGASSGAGQGGIAGTSAAGQGGAGQGGAETGGAGQGGAGLGGAGQGGAGLGGAGQGGAGLGGAETGGAGQAGAGGSGGGAGEPPLFTALLGRGSINAMAAIDGGVIVAGGLAGSITLAGVTTDFGRLGAFVARLGQDGAVVWASAIPGGADFADLAAFNGVSVDPSGNTVAVGTFAGTAKAGDPAAPSQGKDDAVIVKLDPDGHLLWTRTFGSTETDTLEAVTLDAQGNLLLAGVTAGMIDLGGGAKAPVGSQDVFLLRLDPAGKYLSEQRFGAAGSALDSPRLSGDGAQACLAVSAIPAAEISFGATKAAGAFALVRLDGAGGPLWSKGFGSSGRGLALSCPDASHIALGGSFQGDLNLGGPTFSGPPPGGLSASPFVASFDGDGYHVWSNGASGSGLAGVRAISVDATGAITAAGAFAGSLDLAAPTGPLMAGDNTDPFFARLSPTGATLSARGFSGPDSDGAFALVVEPDGAVILGGTYGGSIDFGSGTIGDGSDLSHAFVIKLPKLP